MQPADSDSWWTLAKSTGQLTQKKLLVVCFRVCTATSIQQKWYYQVVFSKGRQLPKKKTELFQKLFTAASVFVDFEHVRSLCIEILIFDSTFSQLKTQFLHSTRKQDLAFKTRFSNCKYLRNAYRSQKTFKRHCFSLDEQMRMPPKQLSTRLKNITTLRPSPSRKVNCTITFHSLPFSNAKCDNKTVTLRLSYQTQLLLRQRLLSLILSSPLIL